MMRRALATGFVAVLTVAGCADSEPDPPAPVAASSPEPAGHGSLGRIYAALTSSGTDYQPAASTLALAQRSELVAEGIATGVRAGRSIGDPELGLPPRTTVLLDVAVDRTHRGPRQQRVLVELSAEGLTAAQVSAALPDRMRVLVYARPAGAPDVGEKVISTSAEWRSVPQVWQPVNPQGLLFAYAGEVIAPLDDRRFPGLPVSAFHPSSKPFPQGREV